MNLVPLKRTLEDEISYFKFPAKEVAPVFLLAFLLPLIYALYTGHIWEDFFITFRHCVNWVQGRGLVYQPGVRVHGFTSPLGTLLPALLHGVTGGGSYLPALWLYRVVCALTFATTTLIQRRTLIDAGFSKWQIALFFAFFLCDLKSVAFTTNGMETAFLIFFVSYGISFWSTGLVKRWPGYGACFAGLMWTRPDGCIYFVALTIALLVRHRKDWRQEMTGLLKALVLGLLLYLPWVVFAWGYYGSPIPHTVLAKKKMFSEAELTLLSVFQRGYMHVDQAFLPIYFMYGGWPDWMMSVTRLIGSICALLWLTPIKSALARGASFCYFFVLIYFSFINVFPWYVPGIAVFAYITLATLFKTFMDIRVSQNYRWGMDLATASLTAFLVGLFSFFLIAGTYQMKVQQALIEEGVRKEIGLWLKEKVQPGETVFLEPVGYIGFFSNANIVDYPGLVSPQMLKARELTPYWARLIEILKPDWLVLRPLELRAVDTPYVQKHYEKMAKFDATEAIEAVPFLMGKGYVMFDAKFEIFRRVIP